jgi:hypothetical protein
VISRRRNNFRVPKKQLRIFRALLKAASHYKHRKRSTSIVPFWGKGNCIPTRTSMRTVKFTQATCGLLLAASVVVSVAGEAVARTRFDGLWSVSIVTQRGNCDRSYRYPVAITNGVVQHADQGDPSVAISGRVSGSGAVAVSVRRGDQYARGSGRLSTITGQGQWLSPTSGCAGYWSAERRIYSGAQ